MAKHLRETLTAITVNNYSSVSGMNNRNGDNRSCFRSEVVLAGRDGAVTSLHRSLESLDNFRRNLHAFLSSPFKSQGDEVEQEVPSRSLRTVYSTVSCTAIAYNFAALAAKIVSSAWRLPVRSSFP